MQHHVNHNCIERGRYQLGTVHIAGPDMTMAIFRRLKLRPGDGQHFARSVYSNTALNPICEQPQHTAGTGTDIQHIAAMIGKQRQKSRFDHAFVDIKRAQ